MIALAKEALDWARFAADIVRHHPKTSAVLATTATALVAGPAIAAWPAILIPLACAKNADCLKAEKFWGYATIIGLATTCAFTGVAAKIMERNDATNTASLQRRLLDTDPAVVGIDASWQMQPYATTNLFTGWKADNENKALIGWVECRAPDNTRIVIATRPAASAAKPQLQPFTQGPEGRWAYAPNAATTCTL